MVVNWFSVAIAIDSKSALPNLAQPCHPREGGDPV